MSWQCNWCSYQEHWVQLQLWPAAQTPDKPVGLSTVFLYYLNEAITISLSLIFDELWLTILLSCHCNSEAAYSIWMYATCHHAKVAMFCRLPLLVTCMLSVITHTLPATDARVYCLQVYRRPLHCQSCTTGAQDPLLWICSDWGRTTWEVRM